MRVPVNSLGKMYRTCKRNIHIREFRRMIATLLPICPIARPYHSLCKIIHFTGRYVELKMLPRSFSEYRNALQSTADDNALFDRYLTYGGLPQVVQAQNASCTDSTTPPNRPDRPEIAGSGAKISEADGSGDRQSA